MAKENKVTENQLVAYCASGKPTKYDKKKHIPLLAKSFFKGDSVRQFCAQALISEKTFYNWLKKHKEFKHAYDISLNFASDFWERIPFENPEFNYPYLQAVLRHRFGFGKPSVNFKDTNSPTELVEAVQKALRDKEVTLQEAVQLVEIALKKQQLLSSQPEQSQALPNLSEEFILENIDKFNEAMRHLKEHREREEEDGQ